MFFRNLLQGPVGAAAAMPDDLKADRAACVDAIVHGDWHAGSVSATTAAKIGGEPASLEAKLQGTWNAPGVKYDNLNEYCLGEHLVLTTNCRKWDEKTEGECDKLDEGY
jgi:hypothetical protein